jgi:hypothetical protein
MKMLKINIHLEARTNRGTPAMQHHWGGKEARWHLTRLGYCGMLTVNIKFREVVVLYALRYECILIVQRAFTMVFHNVYIVLDQINSLFCSLSSSFPFPSFSQQLLVSCLVPPSYIDTTYFGTVQTLSFSFPLLSSSDSPSITVMFLYICMCLHMCVYISLYILGLDSARKR